ncbi:UDP-phosphate alpha N-acetylglucosaminyltransferase [uncultured Roseibium sp.]|uniref:UDP-phosphate alpha N-acetylglucosaminyltransferase n=1 Tax=uncultured Roseibium sp. TaxID=1936171 RepID=UPI0026305717|nr:UDP-phosphate alpha N-acetylglucosaminyltransferase [uncultured Roseibium sp.]
MSYSTLSDRQVPLRTALDHDQAQYRLWLMCVYAVVVGTLTFNFALAFANTNAFRISESYVILSEMGLLSAALFLIILSRNSMLFLLLFLYFSYVALVLALRPELDLKAIRDFLIPIVFYFIGKRFKRIEDADRLVWISTVIVLSVAFFEYFFLDLYTRMVSIFDYYVARGTLTADANFVEGSNLFVSSTRIGGRNFLAFLGDVRASSVFLEPVTMGNFGAFLCLWALFRSGMKHRALMFLAAFTAVILPDARFGMFVCIALIAAAAAGLFLPRITWWSLPVLILFALGIYGGWNTELNWTDDLGGRLLHASQLLQEVTPEILFGVAANVPFLADNGFAYSLAQIGVVGLLGLWTCYVFAPYEDQRAIQFKALAATYIALLMTISNSFYSIKLAALFWIAAGAADAMRSRRPASRGLNQIYRGKSPA